MAKNNSIIRHSQDGIEFFTIEQTGESGMSVSGLALCCGVSRRSLHRYFTVNQIEWKLDEVRVISVQTGKNTPVTIVKDVICAEMIGHYAEQNNPKAMKSLIGFAKIGIRAFIQQQTGWTPSKQSASLFLGDIICREPQPWERHFSKEWQHNAERLTGWKWEYRVMGKFINKHVYEYMPAEIQRLLDEVNPVEEGGYRLAKHHQHFTNDANPILRSHIGTVEDLMRASVCLTQFEDLMVARFKNVYQLSFELPKGSR